MCLWTCCLFVCSLLGAEVRCGPRVCVCVRGWRWVPPPPPPPPLCRLSGLCTDLRLPCSPSAGVATTHPGSPLVFLVLLPNFISSARCVAHHRSRGLFFRGKTCRCKMDWGDNSAKCGYLGKGEYFCREQPFLGGWITIMEEDDGHHENGIHAVKDSDRQQRLRLCVLNEILNTERDYVRTLLFLQSVSVTLPFTVLVFTFRYLCHYTGRRTDQTPVINLPI